MWNFNAGPAVLPLPALEHAQRELLDFEGTGMSILEHSHRGKAYEAVHAECKALLKEVLAIPEGYTTLFLQGGASQQFAQVPMNLVPVGKSADYVITGTWAEKAYAEAQIVGKARVACTTKANDTYVRVPESSEIKVDPDAAYVHITSNNTIYGTQYHSFPEPGSVPLVADMSSDILWRPTDVSRFGLIYAGAQKNMGPAGITIVIIRNDLLERSRTDGIPKIFRYKTIAGEDSLYNTIPVFAVYFVRNVLRWVKHEGGLTAMESRNREKGKLLYDTVDALSGFYQAPVDKGSRSYMNAVFRLPSEDLEKKFLSAAEKGNMVGLKGHRSVGGVRASMYNALPVAAVKALTDLMREFASKNG